MEGPGKHYSNVKLARHKMTYCIIHLHEMPEQVNYHEDRKMMIGVWEEGGIEITI